MSNLNDAFDIPVLFLIFNRPEPTKKVFEEIKKARPKKLYIASDGARIERKEEKDVVVSTREYVLQNIDWDCEVKTLFRASNLGCGTAVGGAIDWFFENEELGIILEDDCLPSQSFFNFCEENLFKYKEDERISSITGNNFSKIEYTKDSYFFSRFIFIWGWATWRRSWSAHQDLMKDFSRIINPSIKTLAIDHKYANSRIINNAIKANSGAIDTWDYQWILSNYLNNGLIITPKVNLVKNIGFNEEATHTKKENTALIIEASELEFPLIHPQIKIPNIKYDNFLYSKIFQWRSLFQKIVDFQYVKRILKRFLAK